MWRSDNGIVRALPPYRGHGPQTYGPTDGRLPLQIAPRQQTIASVPRRRDTRETYKRKSPKITTKKLWIVFSTLVLIVGFTCLYFGLRAANGASSGAQDQTTSAVSEETTITTATEQVLYALDTTFEAEMADPTKEAFTRLENSACSEWETAYSAVGQTADSCQMLSARNGSVVLELMLKFTLTSSGVTAVRLKDAMQVFAEQNASFSAASQCLDANIVNEFSVLLDSSNDLCGRTTECDNYHVCTPDGTSGVTCSCREGYDEVPNYGCVVNCMLANCLTCAATTSCMTCSDGYDLTNEGTCQAKCEVDNCASCINPNICNSCISHYALNTTGASPVCYLICTLANCRTCTSPTSCMTCDTGYDLSNGGSCQALCEVNNCESCADPNACDSCIPNYVLDAAVSPPVCTLNCTLANCTTCASPTSCMTCDAGYDVSNGGMCQAQCDVDNCESCANPNACDLCISNYVLNTAVSPPVCTINCTLANCTTCASPTSCMTCDTGYDVSNGGSCQAQCEVDNCESCAYPNACDSCISNYVLNSAVSPSVCTVNCTLANCTTCASPTFCMTCDAGYDVSNGGSCQALCYPWCVAGCIDPYYCMECPLPYRPDPDTPGNCISDCPFDNAIDTSGHVSIGDRTTAILVDLQGNGISGIAQDKTSPITITYDGQIVFPTTVSTVLQVYLYYNIYLNMTSGLFKYRQYTESDTTELTVAKGYVCKKIMEDTPGAEDCSTCAFRPSWMLHLKIEDVPMNDMYSSSVPGTLNCEIIITSDGTQSFAIGYFTSVPYGVEPAVTIDWGWYFSYYTYSYKYGQVLEEDRFISQSNTEIPGVWVYTLPTRH